MPIFFLSLALSPNFGESRIVLTFFIVHFLLYPASNGYNSYFDRDEKSIGGLKNPPPVKTGLYYTSILLDVFAIIAGLQISILFSIMLFAYGLASKAYSHPGVRLKRLPVIGWLITGFFQGFFSLLMCYEGINALGINAMLKPELLLCGLLSSIMLWANYPMTQIYQHEEDAKRGDKTLSMLLGIRGTFKFTASMFVIATVGFAYYFWNYFNIKYVYFFFMALVPVLLYFLWWYIQVNNDVSKADYSKTMWLNFISSLSLNAFFIFLFLDSSQVLQAIKGGS